jgi:hypothetical protein
LLLTGFLWNDGNIDRESIDDFYAVLRDLDGIVTDHKDQQGQFSNAPVEAPNDLAEIIKLIK